MLLSRVADALYWGARYLERTDDTARLVWGYTEGIVDLPTTVSSTWEPLLSITGSRAPFGVVHGDDARERAIVGFVLADRSNPGSVVSSIDSSRENLRSCRDVFPQFAWTVVNDLHLYVAEHSGEGVLRQSRARFIDRVRRDADRVDGIVATTMMRDAAYRFWQIGQLVERADMTTRVLGVQAAGLLNSARLPGLRGHAEVQWMTVLRSLSGRQMYQRATHLPISGPPVVDFLLHQPDFPRSVRFCIDSIEHQLRELPRSAVPLGVLAYVRAELERPIGDADDGVELDAAMDRIQFALGRFSEAIVATYG